MTDHRVREANKAVVRRLVADVMNAGRLEVLDDIYAPALSASARRWIEPFRAAFPDVHMEVVDLVAEDETVAARFTCAGTHLGEWRGRPATGRRFKVAEVYFFVLRDGRITSAWGLEDTHRRMQQLGLTS